jgi:hypothetical protein
MNTSSSTSTSSYASSGVPGIGHLSGKGIKWVGIQILKGVGVVEMNRRRWVIGRLVKEIGRVDASRSGDWLVDRRKAVNHAVNDILELSLYLYVLLPCCHELMRFN